MSAGASVSTPEVPQTTRQDEKKQLQGLNSRLAGLIDKVRTLQSENIKMTRKRIVMEDHQTVEIKHLKESYESEKKNIRDAIEEMTNKYKDLRLTANGLIKENQELTDKKSKLSATLKKSQNESKIKLQKEREILKNKVSNTEEEMKYLNEKIQQLTGKKE